MWAQHRSKMLKLITSMHLENMEEKLGEYRIWSFFHECFVIVCVFFNCEVKTSSKYKELVLNTWKQEDE